MRRSRSKTSIAISKKGKEVEDAILTGAAQIAVPAFVSTLAICIVFVPMFFLGGVAKYLFVPLAEAVVFAMLASYFLSRTIVPTMAKYLLKGHEHDRVEQARASRNPFVRFQITFEHYFEKLRNWYHGVLNLCLEYRAMFLLAIVAFWIGSLALLYPWLGQDFFPSVDGGQFKLHVRAHTGTRIEDTARLCDQIEDVIRERDSAGGTGHDHRQHRPSLLGPESFLFELRSGGHRRCRHPGFAGREASAHRGVHARAARQADAATFPAPSSTICRPTW